MSHAAELPQWAAVLTAMLTLLGAALALIGSIGLLRLKSFYERVHAPTLGTTLGTTFILTASIVFFSVLESRATLHELLIGGFMIVTTPVTFVLLVRAALHRDSSAPHESGAQRSDSPTPVADAANK